MPITYALKAWELKSDRCQLVTHRYVDQPVLGMFGSRSTIYIASVEQEDYTPTADDVTGGGRFSCD